METDEIKNLIDIYISPLSQKWKLSHSDNIEIGCPFCKDEKNLSISLSKQIYNCWNCHASGRLLFLFKKFSNLEGLEKYISITKQFSHVSNFDNLFITKEEYKKQEIILPENCISISEIFANKHKIDYIIYEPYIDYLINKRYLDKFLLYKFNIYIDIKNEKIIVPSYDKLGNLNLYFSRGINDKADYFIKGNKNEVIFNEYLINFNIPIILVEGFFDGVRLKNFCPLLGKDLSENSLLFRKIILNNTPILLILDNEKGTIKNKLEIADKIKKYNSKHVIYIGEIKDNSYKDIGSIKNLDIDSFAFYEYNDELKFNLINKL